MKISTKQALAQLASIDSPFKVLFQHESIEVEIYQPDKVDLQQPHDRDEIYIVIAGSGQFFNAGKTVDFGPGDFLFVPAGAEHRFLDFTTDFSTWVFFFGPRKASL